MTARFLQKWRLGKQYKASFFLDPLLESVQAEERPRLTAMAMGVLRHLTLLEHILDSSSTVPPKKIHPRLRSCLLVSIYQILFDDSLPDHAVLSSAVSLSIPHHRPFANAVLRGVTRTREAWLQQLIPALPLALRTSFPEQIIRWLEETFSDIDPAFFLEYLNREPVFHALPVEDLIRQRKGVLPGERTLPLRKTIRSVSSLHALGEKELRLHETFIQNISSQFIAHLSARLNPRRVLDLCSAPGSKSTLLALLSPETLIAAGDISHAKLLRLMKRKKDCPDLLQQVSVFCADATNPPFRDGFDLILLDAPCSALGTIRKNPDRRYQTSEQQTEELGRRQALMLQSALDNFPDADILYSVCTFTLPETRRLIEDIAASNAFPPSVLSKTQETVVCALEEEKIPHRTSAFGTYILPDKDLNTDLFFLCLLPARHRSSHSVLPVEAG